MAKTSRRTGNLPAEVTTFVGRRRELAELKKRLTETRLLSLVGPGGVGKTRLAIRGAADLSRGFKDGAWLVELAEVRDAALVSNAVLAALDLRDQAAADPLTVLLAYVRDRDLLLVVDNCEHLLAAAADVIAAVIKAAPEVRVIATTREPLSLTGEHILPVPPLELPPSDPAIPIAQLRQNEAVLLFCERAAAASGAFQLSAANRAAVAELCRRLDGLPLAIELAAVRMRVLGVEQINSRLSDRFNLLAGGPRAAMPRHQTLRTTLDWSYELLTPDEQKLLRRLGVFAGRFTLEDVEGVGSTERPLDLLSSLVDKSLVIKEEVRGVACYRLHDTMREYARVKVKEAGEEDSVEEQCIRHYWSACRRADENSQSNLVEWLAWMDLEIDNVRWVLRRCAESGDYERGLGLIASLRYFWITRATTEGAGWLDEMLAPGRSGAELIARAYCLRARLASLQGDVAGGRPAIEQALAAARSTKHRGLLSEVLSTAAIIETWAGKPAAALELISRAQNATDRDDVRATLSLLQARALHAVFGDNVGGVNTASLEGVRLSRESGDLYALGMMLLNMGGAALLTGDLDTARERFIEALRVARTTDDRVAQYYLLEGLGFCAASSGQPRLGVQLLGAAESIRAAVGVLAPDSGDSRLMRAKEEARRALGPTRYESEFEAGRQLPREVAVSLALGESPQALVTNGARSSPLGTREVEVARLIAAGLSNKQIGARLFISERTVDAHVRNILNKLGFNSRMQIAAWTASSNQ